MSAFPLCRTEYGWATHDGRFRLVGGLRAGRRGYRITDTNLHAPMSRFSALTIHDAKTLIASVYRREGKEPPQAPRKYPTQE